MVRHRQSEFDLRSRGHSVKTQRQSQAEYRLTGTAGDSQIAIVRPRDSVGDTQSKAGARRLVLTHMGDGMLGRLDEVDLEVAADGLAIDV